MLLAFLLCAPPVLAKSPEKPKKDCANVGVMAKRLMKEEKLAYLADAIDEHDRVHMWFINRHKGDWIELEVANNLQACIVRHGYDWHFAVGN